MHPHAEPQRDRTREAPLARKFLERRRRRRRRSRRPEDGERRRGRGRGEAAPVQVSSLPQRRAREARGQGEHAGREGRRRRRRRRRRRGGWGGGRRRQQRRRRQRPSLLFLPRARLLAARGARGLRGRHDGRRGLLHGGLLRVLAPRGRRRRRRRTIGRRKRRKPGRRRPFRRSL